MKIIFFKFIFQKEEQKIILLTCIIRQKKDLPWLNVMVFLFCFSSCTNLLLFATSAHILRVVFVFGFLRLVANGVISGSNCRLTLFFEAAIRTCIFSLRGNGAVRTSICGRYFLFSYEVLLNLEAFW